jgi:hypothetical protein
VTTVAPTQTPTSPSPTVIPPTATPTTGCEGDCDADGRVTVDELVRAVRINLGELPLSACPAFGAATSVRIEQLVRAVNNALRGCTAS